MARDINQRLQQLRTRRDGTRGTAMDSAALNTILFKSAPPAELWESRGSGNQAYTRYALGAMQAVGETYTRVSKDTANRVAKQLKERLTKYGIYADFELQGSVPLDVHIKGVSDVDLLALSGEMFWYDGSGVRALRGDYKNPAKRQTLEVLNELRACIEIELPEAFPKASVDTRGAKAVKISGASLERDVDVVPAIWHDTERYQATSVASDRGTKILDKKKQFAVPNQPFRHIELVRTRCEQLGGGLRKAIRLCKNVKADSDRNIALPSFDIAALMYHANQANLRLGQLHELAILSETQRFLDELARNATYAKTLRTPDETRAVLDSEEKVQALVMLSIEMDELLDAVYAEHEPSHWAYNRDMNDKREVVSATRL